MIIENKFVWEDKQTVPYTVYLQDNSPEIENNRKHPAIIVCGGGGFLGISDREKEPVALYYLSAGFQAFVLDYTTGPENAEFPLPLYDIAKMVSIVRTNAEKWHIDPDQISIIGFSAGGNLCAQLAVHWQDETLKNHLAINDSKLIKPNAVILAYPLIDFVEQAKQTYLDPNVNETLPYFDGTKKEFIEVATKAFLGSNYDEVRMKEASPYYYISENHPPTFIWGTANDELVYATQIAKYVLELLTYRVPVEYHLFEEGVHGLSLSNNQSGGSSPEWMREDVSIWTELSITFLKKRFNF